MTRDIVRVMEDLTAWWELKAQEYPCLVTTSPRLPPPEIPETDDLDTYWGDVDFVVDRTVATIDATVYYADAVPFHSVGYGASTMAGVLGARMECIDKETVWAYPVYDSIEQVLESGITERWRSTHYWKTLVACTEMSARKAPGHHYIDVFPLGGAMDNLAALYGTENLMMDLIEKPELVKRAMGMLKEIWIDAFQEMTGIISGSGNDGFIGWAGVWSPGSTFPMQEDISYMISGDMYREFCLPHIGDCAEAMEFPFYHLDGIPALSHLDALLELDSLKVIQWVPGAGHEEIAQWYGVLEKIIDGGKSCQAFCRFDEIAGLVKNVGAKGLLITCYDSDPEMAAELACAWNKT